MTTEDTVQQYAQDQLVECGWNRDEINMRLARQTLTQIASGDPHGIVDKLIAYARIIRETERIIIGREAIKEQYGELWPKKSAW